MTRDKINRLREQFFTSLRISPEEWHAICDLAIAAADMTELDAVRRALEAAAKVCQDLAMKHWREYKSGERRGDTHLQGKSDGAEDCAEVVSALRAEDFVLSEAVSAANKVVEDLFCNDQRGEAATTAATQGESPTAAPTQSSPHQSHADPDAWLVTYYEDTKAGARKCCTFASLEPYPPSINLLETDVADRTLIRAEPLFLSPAEQVQCNAGTEHQSAPSEIPARAEGPSAVEELEAANRTRFDVVALRHAEELDRLRKERNSALDLLAVIHRDGGHYTEAVGFIKSCADAIETRTKLVLELDRLRAENERLKDDIRQMVEKTADRSLAGYRELGNKAAAAELRAERAEAKLASGVVVPEHPSVAILLAMSPWFSGDTHAIKREEVYKAMLAAAKEGKQ